MSGDERVRFCKLCSKHVYHLSAMSRIEPKRWSRKKKARHACAFTAAPMAWCSPTIVRSGLRVARDRTRWIGAGVAALFAFAGSCAAAFGSKCRSWEK